MLSGSLTIICKTRCPKTILSHTMTQPWVRLHDLESDGQLLATTCVSGHEDDDVASRQIHSDDDDDDDDGCEELRSGEVRQKSSPTRASSMSLSVKETTLPSSARHVQERWYTIHLRDCWLETLSMLSVVNMFGTIDHVWNDCIDTTHA